MLLHVSSTRAHRQEAKIALYNLWYHHTYRWSSRHRLREESFLNLWTGRPPTECDDTRGCLVQFLLPDDEHVCSKHVEA